MGNDHDDDYLFSPNKLSWVFKTFLEVSKTRKLLAVGPRLYAKAPKFKNCHI